MSDAGRTSATFVFGFALISLLGIAGVLYFGRTAEQEARQADFDMCRLDKVAGHCPVGYRLSRGIRD